MWRRESERDEDKEIENMLESIWKSFLQKNATDVNVSGVMQFWSPFIL